MKAPVKIGRLPMMRISLSYIYDLASRLEPLERMEERDTPWSEIWLDCILAQSTVENLYVSLYAPFMRASATVANDLVAILKKEGTDQDFNRTIGRYTITSIKNAYRNFKIVLQADLSILHSVLSRIFRTFDQAIAAPVSKIVRWYSGRMFM
jgi:hypothetical protein